MEDPIGAVVTQLTSAWTPANTDSVTPTIAAVFNYKRVDARNGDYALVYAVSHSEKSAGLGYGAIDYTDVVSIDIRTAYGSGNITNGRAHLIKLRDEARRCVYAAKTSLGGYVLASIDNVQDMSDKSILLWRMVIDVKLRKLPTAAPA